MKNVTIISSHDDLAALLGEEVGRSNWRLIPQEMINAFADATGDYQWIHTDTKRSAEESPYGKTIAHGFLAVSLLPSLLDEIIEVRNSKLTVNYAMENLRFGTPVLVNSRVRLILTVENIRDLRGTTRVTFGVTLEIEGEKKPAYKGNVVLLYHFK
ncbi:acyl dehydratase [Candidatus Fermentibacteria bacterium]|nr:MAG: acyl dehydratase [Candidatus Fermentibacteria bacterium]